MTLIGKFIEFKGQYLADSINRPFKIVKFKLSKTNELAGTIGRRVYCNCGWSSISRC